MSSRRSATIRGARPLNIAGGEIRFDHVRFGYAPGAVALDDISLTIPAGRTVASGRRLGRRQVDDP